MKTFWKSVKCRVWMIVSLVVAVLFAVITVLTTTIFSSIISTVVGGRRVVYADGIDPIYTSDYNTKAATLEAANALNERACEEGFVLLKNEDNALPMATRESGGNQTPRISVFGKNSVNLAYGGTGSGGAMDSQLGDRVDLYASLEEAGYEVNPELKAFYENTNLSGPVRTTSTDMDSGDTVVYSTAETPQSSYTQAVKDSYDDYSDAALVVFTRQGGEGADFPRLMKGATGARDENDHFLQLDQNETDLLKAVCGAGFGKVIVIINSGTPMELAFLEDEDYYAYQQNIDAAIWMGYPGNTGVMALGRILNGQVNPSGKLPDTYAADFKQDPSWFNFGDNRITGNMTADPKVPGGDQYILNGDPQLYYFVDYEESIYVGYRYYETRGAQDEEWYKDAVVYPFGYGLSYTDFTWTVTDISEIEDVAVSQTDADSKTVYSVTINVRNSGSVAGKDTVQLYGHAPYYQGEIEKPEEVLVDFAKTPLLQPGEDADVTLTFDPYYLASYDYKDANKNGAKGFELDAGDYALYINSDAHTREFTVPFSVAADIYYANDPVTGNPVENRFTDQENAYFNSDTQLSTVLSRSDWTGTMPDSPTADEYNVTEEFIEALKDVSTNNPTDYNMMEMPWFDEDVTITLRDMLTDEEGNFGSVSYGDERWEALLDQCSPQELITMYDDGAFKTSEIESIGKPLTNDTDGPAGFVNFMSKDGTYWGTCYYACETVMAATWNEELLEEIGVMIGNEGIWGADGRGNGMPYTGWYAPGANIHRSPFGGRNHEYFSEDGLLSGKLAAAQIRGCQSKGVYCYMKHFALNEQETHRSIGGLVTWATEQSMRELYFRPFEIAVKEGGTRAMMSSFNRIGTRWTGGDYRLLTEILRNEWGFEGMVICDYNTIPQYMDARQMAYAGGDINLQSFPLVTWADESDTGDMIVLRQAAKNVLYTVANSNAMNGEIIGYRMPVWQIVLIVVDCLVVAGIAVWGFFAIRSAYKKKPEASSKDAQD